MNKDLQTYIDQASKHFEAADYEKAYQQFSRAIFILEEQEMQGLIEPDIAEIFFRRALVLLAMDEKKTLVEAETFHQVIEDLDQAIELNPSQFHYRIIRGRMYMNNEFADFFTEAGLDFQYVLEADPNHAEALKHMGEMLTKKEEFAQAIPFLSHAISHEKDTEALMLRGVAYVRKYPPDFRAALRDFDQVKESEPGNEALYLWRSQCFQELGHWDLAIAEYDTLIDISPNNPGYYTDRGFLHSQNRMDLALADYNKALDIAPHPMAFNNRANYYREVENYEAALSDAYAALKADPNFGIAYASLAEIYADMHDISQLAKYLELAMKFYYEDSLEILDSPIYEPYIRESWFQELLNNM